MGTARRLLVAALAIASAGATVASAPVSMTPEAPEGATLRLDSPVFAASSGNPIAQRFPKQWNAKQGGWDASRHWALIIGISAYQSPTRDTIGGKRDAQLLKRHLRSLGWREDHILLLSNKNATRSMIIAGINWLRSKTDGKSTVVFAFSGHEKPFRTSADGDDEARDVAIHTHENRYILDGELGRRLGPIKAKKMWLHFATCRAGGFDDRGIVKQRRVVTYSSPEHELSYEDPEFNLSVFNNHTVSEGMAQAMGDRNGDGETSVEEAFKFARPRVEIRTSDRQHPRMIDRLDGQLILRPRR